MRDIDHRIRLLGQRHLADIADHPNNRYLTPDRADRRAHIWNTASGKLHAKLEGHEGTIFQVALSRDGRLAATAIPIGRGSQFKVHLPDAETVFRVATDSMSEDENAPQAAEEGEATWEASTMPWVHS